MSLRYDVVRFAYAGESRYDKRRVVKEEGREESESGGSAGLSDFFV